MHVTYISKLEFLPAFREVFFASITDTNIQGSFAGASLILYDPERVISKLDVQLQTPIPSNSRLGTLYTWVSKTLQNPLEADLQTCLIKSRVANYLDSSPTSMLSAIDQFAKGAKAIMYEVAFLRAENSTLRKANKALSKRQRAKKTRIQRERTLTVQEAEDLLEQRDINEQRVQETRQSSGQAREGRTKPRCCSICGKPGHTARTCQKVI